ncbi:hypothetical protein [Cellvibrio polysaccharolyticus]|uniref:hypothetical protein n=1 Tax=Cellvibrio polysaccharolyticus TaxID=2082724 RepID=UPI00187F5371|nr:hypothetical protein [Cellvibrio polysaccharolyticus]
MDVLAGYLAIAVPAWEIAAAASKPERFWRIAQRRKSSGCPYAVSFSDKPAFNTTNLMALQQQSGAGLPSGVVNKTQQNLWLFLCK